MIDQNQFQSEESRDMVSRADIMTSPSLSPHVYQSGRENLLNRVDLSRSFEPPPITSRVAREGNQTRRQCNYSTELFQSLSFSLLLLLMSFLYYISKFIFVFFDLFTCALLYSAQEKKFLAFDHD